MNERQKAFADYYIETNNAVESYRKTYKPKSDKTALGAANKLLKNAEIKLYIKERLASKDKERIASQDEVLERLTAIMRGEVTDQLGLETPVKEMVKAAELLGKRYKIFTDKVEHTGKDGDPLNVIFNIPRPRDDKDG
ncbi:MAG: terminase small subunit [Deltaproteobacteria bacterium]